MASEFRREYLQRLPLPLAQLYSRAHNAKDARGRHDNTYYLFEALVKSAAVAATAAYLDEVRQGAAPAEDVDPLLAHMASPSLGQWVALLRASARRFGTRPDASSHPLGGLWEQLTRPRLDLPGTAALYRRIKNGPDGEPARDVTCSPLHLIEALVQYRNGVFGHGAGRFLAFYEQEMGPLLFPAANELLAEGVLDLLGRVGSRLVYLTELRLLDDGGVEVALRELVGWQSARLPPLLLPVAEAVGLAPNRVALLWPGRPRPLRLDPLVLYRESELTEEVLFLNRGRDGRHVEYLSYTTGRIERDQAAAPALAALLSRAVGRAEAADETPVPSDRSVAEESPIQAAPPEAAPARRTLGDFEILAEVGRGGMGVVYLARQETLGRLVALKTLPADLADDEAALTRFRREIRALARCDHPHIVKVLASGALPDGQLYYAMEYVPGCDLEQVWQELAGAAGSASGLAGGSLSAAVLSASRKRREQALRRSPAETAPPAEPGPTPAVLDEPGGFVRRVAALVRDAALALQAMHDQGLVHRDVKPSNLMLTPDGSRVVLMDFGLAKGESRTLSASRRGGLLGTLRYAAPEQLAAANLRVGPAADVRGLGVTLWELLTRRRLFADAADEKQLAQMVHDVDVPRLRQIDPTLDRDLEAITARATERRVADRIPTAAKLAEYLQLYLDGRPLPIRPPGTAERVGRWVRTHKPLVISAAAAVVAVLASVVTAFVLISGARDDALRLAGKNGELAEANARLATDEKAAADAADQARQKALAEAAKANAVAELLEGTFRASDPLGLDGVSSYIPKKTGEKLSAVDLLSRGQKQVETLDAPPDVRARMMDAIGTTWCALGRYDEADKMLQAAYKLRQDNPATDPLDVATSLHNLAWLAHEKGDYERAEPMYRRALEIREQRLGPDDLQVGATLFHLAWMLAEKRDFAGAEPLFLRAIDLRTRRLGAEHRDVAVARMGLAAMYIDERKFTDALVQTQQAIQIIQKVEGQGSLAQAMDLFEQGMIARDVMHLPAAARSNLEECLQRAHDSLPGQHVFLAVIEVELARTLEVLHEDDKAEKHYRESVRIVREEVTFAHPRTIILVQNFGAFLQRTGRPEEADALYEELIAAHKDRFGAKSVRVGEALTAWAGLLNEYFYHPRKGEATAPIQAKMEQVLREALAIAQASGAPKPPWYKTALIRMRETLLMRHAPQQEMEPVIRDLAAQARAESGEESLEAAMWTRMLADVLMAQRKYDGVEDMLVKVETVFAKVAVERKVDLSVTLDLLNFLYCNLGRLADAEAVSRRRQTYWPGDAEQLQQTASELDRCAQFVWRNKPAPGPDDPAVSRQYTDKAVAAYRQALDAYRAAGPDRRFGYKFCLFQLAMDLVMQGKQGDAEPLLAEAALLYRKELSPQNTDTALVLLRLAEARMVVGRGQNVEQPLRDALKIYESIPGEPQPLMSQVLSELASYYRVHGRTADAAALARERRERWPRTSIQQSLAAQEFVMCAASAADPDERRKYEEEAEAAFREAVRLYRAADQHAQDGGYMMCLVEFGKCLVRNNHREEALEVYREAVPLWRRNAADPRYPGAQMPLADLLGNYGAALLAAGQTEEGEKVLGEALTLAEKLQPPLMRPTTLAPALDQLGVYYRGAHRIKEAAGVTRKRMDFWPKDPGQLCQAAAELASCAAVTDDAAERREYEDEALAALSKAAECGFKNGAQLDKDPRFDPLRSRTEFKDLVGRMKEQRGADGTKPTSPSPP